MAEDKKTFRKQMQRIRDGIPTEDRKSMDLMLCEILAESDVYQSAKVIYSYASYKSEAATEKIHEMIRKDGKILALPKVISKTEMVFYVIESEEDLTAGYMGIPEPDQDRCRCIIPDGSQETLMLMPGLAFDDERYRMGYGGGFYDRYLAQYREHLTCAMIAYEAQKVSAVPHDRHDEKPDLIMTDQCIYR